MKRLALVLVLLLAVSGATLFAQASFSSLPSGSWLDTNFNGLWTFSAAGITIKCNETGASNTFTTSNIKGLTAVAVGMSAGIQFSSDTFGKRYTFAPNVTNGTMTLTIDRDGLPQYTVTMQKR